MRPLAVSPTWPRSRPVITARHARRTVAVKAAYTQRTLRSASPEYRGNGKPSIVAGTHLTSYYEDIDTALKDLFPNLEAYEKAKSAAASKIHDDLASALARITKKMAGKPGAVDFQRDYERVIGTNDMVPVNYLNKGLLASATVARVVGDDFYASGFMVGPRLFMTNRHVFPNPDVARGSVLEFNYELDNSGTHKHTEVYRLSPDDCFILGDAGDLDYCLVAVEPQSERGVPLSHWGYLQLLATTGKVDEGEWVSIIQHPGGDPKQVALRENQVIKIGDLGSRPVLLYRSDTAPGSSGSPCFNDNWNVVALHSRGIPKKTEDGKILLRTGEGISPQDDRIKNPMRKKGEAEIICESNLGVRISAIIADIGAKAGPNRDGQGALVRDFLTDIQRAGPRTPPIVTSSAGPLVITRPGNAVRSGDHGIGVVGTEARRPASSRPSRPSAARGRRGYDPNFLGLRVMLPTLTDGATERFGEPYVVPETGTYEIKYTHFSVIMNKYRRLAYVSAVNIDGANRVDIDREGNGFFLDPNLSEEIQCGDWLYKRNKLDRGHITRRQDPVWGSAQEAEQANADSFTFTNIGPQHKDFNQGKQLWLGLEDFVLQNTTAEGARASVFSGPIFRETDPAYRGVQIPEEYYKVVVVVDGEGQLRSSGYIVSQKALVGDTSDLDEAMQMGEFEEQLPIGPFRTFQVSISEIEGLTGLLWDEAVVAADAMAGEAGTVEKGGGSRGGRGFFDGDVGLDGGNGTFEKGGGGRGGRGFVDGEFDAGTSGYEAMVKGGEGGSRNGLTSFNDIKLTPDA